MKVVDKRESRAVSEEKRIFNVTVGLPPEMFDIVAKLARANECSPNAVVFNILHNWMAQVVEDHAKRNAEQQNDVATP